MTNENNLKYITATSALNIPYNGMQCDWHQVDMLSSGNYHIHPVNFIGAEKIFNDYGIYDNTEFFISKGYNVANVLVATPIRAILDVLYMAIVVKKEYPKYFMMEDYLFEEIDHDELKDKLDILEQKIDTKSRDILVRWRFDNQLLNQERLMNKKREAEETMEDLKFVLNQLVDDINDKKIKEDSQLLNTFIEEIKHYDNLLKK